MLLYLQISAEDCTCRHRNFSLFTRTGHAAEIYAVSVRAFGGFTRLATPRADRIGRKKEEDTARSRPLYTISAHAPHTWYTPGLQPYRHFISIPAESYPGVYFCLIFMKKGLQEWITVDGYKQYSLNRDMVLPSRSFLKKNIFLSICSKRCITKE